MKKRDVGACHSEIEIGVETTGLLTAVTIFFTSILITQYETFDPSIKIPILFLIISTFGFLYSTLIVANASGQLTRLRPETFEKHMLLGNVLGEYLGVYFLILAIPLVINVIITDSFLRISTIIVALGGLALYQFSGFSIMQRNYKKYHYIFLIIILILEIIIFYMQLNFIKYFTYMSSILIAFILLLAFFARKEE